MSYLDNLKYAVYLMGKMLDSRAEDHRIES